ncbi:hypothetical protein OHA84_22460 [Streptomyces sp. NBC_00513]|uniref:hypothetical protein n=1 Tax=unclassified Streptomyces TaxID=2593676 RepID=UPI0022593E2F|nr:MULTISPECIES: hypothetical protein [unclassified Streptomyces]MCX5073720.1 hypothetical protein [Streptomyces sp. NBC_00424]MCX5154728.1 hypothetical protein [Streptomyces sp. NBC_00291]WUD43049.1 hypothetical protein OHA84_22460 [Streptomyces sp. NBC_00513]
MRTALRTSIVTAALAGALLAPAAGAFAAPAPQAVTAVSGTTSGSDRYAGELVLVADGVLAVLRNESEGPEVWLRAVGPDWKPSDGWAGHVYEVLNRTHTAATIDGSTFTLVKADTAAPSLTVRGPAGTSSHPLPKGKPSTEPSTKPSAEPSAKPSAKPTVVSSAKPSAAAGVTTKTDVKAQTAVVPRGAVAAGAEISTADTDDSSTVAAGAGLVAIFAALGAAAMHLSRRSRGRA